MVSIAKEFGSAVMEPMGLLSGCAVWAARREGVSDATLLVCMGNGLEVFWQTM